VRCHGLLHTGGRGMLACQLQGKVRWTAGARLSAAVREHRNFVKLFLFFGEIMRGMCVAAGVGCGGRAAVPRLG